MNRLVPDTLLSRPCAKDENGYVMNLDASGARRPPAVIVDMDGTLCDVRSIRHHVDRPKSEGKPGRDFDAFHQASLECPPHLEVTELTARLRHLGLRVLVVSARQERWSFLTALWLRENAVSYDEMYLRANGDSRPDVDVKRDIAKRILTRFRPVVAIDDRDEVIEVWRSFGIAIFKVLEDGSIERLIPPEIALAPRLAALLDGVLPRQSP